MGDEADDATVLASLAERLRDAHRRVSLLAVDDAERARSTRRLLAISETAKRDARRASTRLDGLFAEWDGPAAPPSTGGDPAR